MIKSGSQASELRTKIFDHKIGVMVPHPNHEAYHSGGMNINSVVKNDTETTYQEASGESEESPMTSKQASPERRSKFATSPRLL